MDLAVFRSNGRRDGRRNDGRTTGRSTRRRRACRHESPWRIRGSCRGTHKALWPTRHSKICAPSILANASAPGATRGASLSGVHLGAWSFRPLWAGLAADSRPSTSMLVTSGASSLIAPSTASFTVMRRGRTGLATPGHPQPHHSGRGVGLKQFDVAAVRAQIGTHPNQRLVHPGRKVLGMQAVKDQQTRDHVVSGEPFEHRFARRAGAEAISTTLARPEPYNSRISADQARRPAATPADSPSSALPRADVRFARRLG